MKAKSLCCLILMSSMAVGQLPYLNAYDTPLPKPKNPNPRPIPSAPIEEACDPPADPPVKAPAKKAAPKRKPKPKVVPGPPLRSVEAVAEPVSLAKIDGKWIVAETSVVNAVINVDTNAKWVQARVQRVVTVTIDGQTIDVLTAAPVEVLDIHVAKGKCYGILAGPGKYQVTITCGDPKSGISQEIRQVEIEGEEPIVDPVDPDDPVVVPTDLPFESDGFAVMIVREVSKAPTPGQTSIFTSSKVHKYIGDRALQLSDNQPFYRIFDDDYTTAQLANLPEPLKKAYERTVEAMDGVPWIAIVSKDGKTGFSGPLPANVDDTLELLKKYGE